MERTIKSRFIWWGPAILCLAALVELAPAAQPGLPGVRAERTVIAELGPEHMANCVYRRGIGGDRIAAWGDRIREWAIQPSAQAREVVPREKKVFRYSNGGCAMDVQGDGIDEVVVARVMRGGTGSDLVWWEELRGKQTWREHLIVHLEHERLGDPHDILPFSVKDPSGRTLRGVVIVVARKQLFWYEMPTDVTTPWKEHAIGEFSGKRQSGMAIGDIAGHGRPDVACGMFWAECPDNPLHEPWKTHRFGTWDANGWGGMTKHGLADMDGDGRLDIVAAEAEIAHSRLAIFCRKTKDGDGVWESHAVDTELYCPHSLVVADVNSDGRPDILVGEMTAGGWSFPLNPKPRLLFYRNEGKLRFTRFVVDSGCGVHEMKLAPPRQDGNIMIYAADEIQLRKFKDMHTHVVEWTIGP